MHALIGYWAERKLLLPRSMGELYESIRDFVVVEAEVGGLVGCAALHWRSPRRCTGRASAASWWRPVAGPRSSWGWKGSSA